MHQVEFDVSPSAHLLPLPLLLGKRHVLPLLDDGEIGRQEALQAILDEGKGVFRVGHRLVQVVEEYAADAAGFAAMLVGEVLVTPLLEAGIVVLVVLVTGLLERLVKVDGVLVEQIARCQVASSAKPPGL